MTLLHCWNDVERFCRLKTRNPIRPIRHRRRSIRPNPDSLTAKPSLLGFGLLVYTGSLEGVVWGLGFRGLVHISAKPSQI